MANDFKKEQRYVVLKIKDIIAAELTPDEVAAFNKVCDKVSLHRNQAGKPPLGCVVVEADWRCYDTVWGLVEQEHNQNNVSSPEAALTYQHSLNPWLKLVREHPGSRVGELETLARALPPGEIGVTHAAWKLRCLALQGFVYVEEEKWYPTGKTVEPWSKTVSRYKNGNGGPL